MGEAIISHLLSPFPILSLAKVTIYLSVMWLLVEVTQSEMTIYRGGQKSCTFRYNELRCHLQWKRKLKYLLHPLN